LRTIVALVRSSHPEPVVTVAAVSGLLALTAGRGPGTVWVVLAVLAGQLFVGWSNDYIDRTRDLEAGRKDKPLAAGTISHRTVGAAAVVALVLVIPLSLASGVPAAAVHLAAVASATAYNLGLKATVLSAIPYALSFGLLPAFITLGLPHAHWPPLWVVIAAALIGVGGHFAQVRPDVESDRRQLVIGLPQLLGDRASALAAAGFLAAGALAIGAGAHTAAPLVAFAPAAGVAITPPKIAFRLTLVTAAVTVVAFLANGASLR
jgi:4-hydroxybenzoate polyprenyltransferase